MESLEGLGELIANATLLFIILGVWAYVWKAIALWVAGRNNHMAWFIILFLVNTLGILEIIYIFAVGRKKQQQVTTVS
jgi:methionyl-tRNA synthetase